MLSSAFLLLLMNSLFRLRILNYEFASFIFLSENSSCLGLPVEESLLFSFSKEYLGSNLDVLLACMVRILDLEGSFFF
jgi:hypothetical protein